MQILWDKIPALPPPLPPPQKPLTIKQPNPETKGRLGGWNEIYLLVSVELQI